MATGIPTEALCSCTWCGNVGQVMRPLPCLHSVCDGCLTSHTTTQHISPGGSFRCKLCNQDILLPDKGTSGFPVNTLSTSFTFLCQKDDDLQCDICKRCNSTTTNAASAKCVNCDELMCQYCSIRHQGARLTSAHPVLNISEIRKDDSKFSSLRAKTNFQQCPTHPTERLKYYCTPCAVPICGDCKVTNHDLHPCKMIAEAATKCDNELKDLSATLDETYAKHKKNSKDVTTQEDKLNINFQKIISKIQSVGGMALKSIHNQSESLQKEAEATHRSYSVKLAKHCEGIERKLSGLQCLQEAVTQLQVLTCEASKAELTRYVQEQYQSLQKVDSGGSVASPSNVSSDDEDDIRMNFTPCRLDVDKKLGSFVVSKQVTKVESSSGIPPTHNNESVTVVSKRNHHTTTKLKVIHQFKTLQSGDTQPQVLSGVAVYGDDIVLVDSANTVTRCFNITGKVKNQFQRPDIRKFGCPRSVVVVDKYAFVKSSNQQIQVFDCKKGKYMCMSYMFRNHTGLAVMPDKQILYYNAPRKVLCAFSTQNPTDYNTLNDSRNNVCKVPTSLNYLAYMACNSHNTVALVDPDTKCVYFIDKKGKLLLKYKPRTLQEPAGACADEQGNFYIADTRANFIHMVDHTLSKTEVICKEAGLNGPLALAFHGNLNAIVVTETSGYVKVLQIP